MNILKRGIPGKSSDGEAASLRIKDYDWMPPFLIPVVSRSNIWAYVSSRGSLSAGRESEEQVIFPYLTDDKIHDGYGVTGPQTLMELEDGTIWEPFLPHPEGVRRGKRELSKSVLSDSLTFRECFLEEELCFSYTWQTALSYGLVRRVRLENSGSKPRRIKLLDGILNIMPPGIDARLQATRSNLVDSYKQAELLPHSRMAVYSTASGITDRPFPMENLLANSAWSCGLPGAIITLQANAPELMKNGAAITASESSKGRRGAYWLHVGIELEPGEAHEWMIILDCGLDAAEIAGRVSDLESQADGGKREIEAAITANNRELRELLVGADAFQISKHEFTHAHHTANVLFNSMRGGVFINNYSIPGEHFQSHVKEANPGLYAQNATLLEQFRGWLAYDQCREQIEGLNDPDLRRLFLEYLPITFSRRHGDPSRPWNKFMIHTHDSNGAPVLSYQGNWRDIFQNWEALCISYPRFLEHVVVKFLNTSTMDGYNPYRIFNGSFDWEEVDPEDPFSGIGYWGDHQIVYLLRLLEALHEHQAEILNKWLETPIFVFANVPYRIKPLADIFRNPRSTLIFDAELSEALRLKGKAEGNDGLLLKGADGATYKVTLFEKLLIPALVKLGNFVPGGGIWMNTERPEWNDANNALVGNGLSMVTVGHLLRYLRFCRNWWLRQPEDQEFSLSAPVVDFVHALLKVFDRSESDIRECTGNDHLRAVATNALGTAGQQYRDRVYAVGLAEKKPLPLQQLLKLFEQAELWLQSSLNAAKRTDGLMDSYNLLSYGDPGEALRVEGLYEMLEGQVSAISANHFSGKEVIELLDTMFESALYTAGRNSFLLYPDRRLACFMDKGLIPAEDLHGSKLIELLLQNADSRLVTQDIHGKVRFAPSLKTSEALEDALRILSRDDTLAALIKEEAPLIRSIYGRVFKHHTFTGRSGGMYAYEGLGCIYWHQVSKLLLAVQECFFKESESADPDETLLKALAVGYYKIRSGIGFNKTARDFGAFPTDPYSHTPAHAGAQQPGMTGQTKEEILTRFGELGIRVRSGTIRFNLQLLQSDEFLEGQRRFPVIHPDGTSETIELQSGCLAFTYCQVPFVYSLSAKATEIRIEIVTHSGGTDTRSGAELPAEIYKSISHRTGEIRRVNVTVPQSRLIL